MGRGLGVPRVVVGDDAEHRIVLRPGGRRIVFPGSIGSAVCPARRRLDVDEGCGSCAHGGDEGRDRQSAAACTHHGQDEAALRPQVLAHVEPPPLGKTSSADCPFGEGASRNRLERLQGTEAMARPSHCAEDASRWVTRSVVKAVRSSRPAGAPPAGGAER